MKRSEAAHFDWAVVTVTYNSASALEHFWRGVSLPRNIKWIVVDNASSDNSVQVARSCGAQVIELKKNVGFGAANNIGFHATESKYVAFVNPDVRIQPNDLDILAPEIEGNYATLAAPQLLHPDGELQPNGRGRPFLLSKVRNRLPRSRQSYSYLKFAAPGEVVEVDWLMGAVVAGRREHLRHLGPWDERFFVYYEDSDLGIRNKRGGGRNVVIGKLRWQHGWARETSDFSLAAWRREIPSLVKFYARYPSLLGWPRGRRRTD